MKALLPLALLALAPPAQAAGGAVLDDWRLACVAGEDEFAANCTAEADAGAVSVRIATADSQLSVTVRHPACADHTWTAWRDAVIGLSPEARRRRIAGAVAAARGQCPALPRLTLRNVPDIAVMGEDALGR